MLTFVLLSSGGAVVSTAPTFADCQSKKGRSLIIKELPLQGAMLNHISQYPGRCPTLYTHLLFFEIIGILYICQMKSSPFTSLNNSSINQRHLYQETHCRACSIFETS